jgi:hypothetical protein
MAAQFCMSAWSRRRFHGKIPKYCKSNEQRTIRMAVDSTVGACRREIYRPKMPTLLA